MFTFFIVLKWFPKALFSKSLLTSFIVISFPKKWFSSVATIVESVKHDTKVINGNAIAVANNTVFVINKLFLFLFIIFYHNKKIIIKIFDYKTNKLKQNIIYN